MRESGILLPLFSLPSEYGIGTLGKEAYRFIDFLKASGQAYWQMLPIGPTSYGDSPYQSFSSFAGNPYFIDFEMLKDEKLLDESDYSKSLSYQNTNNDTFNKSFSMLLQYLFNHQTHHRGQVTTLLTQIDIDIGETDLLMLIPDVDNE